jgi:hypothetical protein
MTWLHSQLSITRSWCKSVGQRLCYSQNNPLCFVLFSFFPYFYYKTFQTYRKVESYSIPPILPSIFCHNYFIAYLISLSIPLLFINPFLKSLSFLHSLTCVYIIWATFLLPSSPLFLIHWKKCDLFYFLRQGFTL